MSVVTGGRQVEARVGSRTETQPGTEAQAETHASAEAQSRIETDPQERTLTQPRRKIVVATRNAGKLKEILQLLEPADLGCELVTIDEIAPEAHLIENEPTFTANALAKARQAAAITGLAALADDSGLEVDALSGAPGVRSARFAGEPSDDGRNNLKLLGAMREVPDGHRGARFKCVAAFVDPDADIEITRDGSCEGEILLAPRGDRGFGYDPLFLLPALGLTMAELYVEDKNRLSHRAAAFHALAAALAPILAPAAAPTIAATPRTP
jgi:XTP/dITP diphosphohydrolase